jgi:FHA domain
MTDGWLDRLAAGDWTIAAVRLAFIAVIYLFLFVVLRTTVRELAAVARSMPASDGQLGQASLMVIEAGGSSLPMGAALGLLPRTVIGRDSASDIVVDDAFVSARHSEIRYAHGQWWLSDLGSSNGTLLNGELVRAVVVVRHGDVLQCGRVRFRIVSSTTVPIDHASA